jgi:hypothetical protein
MGNGMDELLAQAYGTHENIAANQGLIEKTAEAEMLDMLEKVAAAEGVDLSQLTEDEVAEILAEAMGAADNTEVYAEKTASAEGDLSEDDKVKLAEADYLGRTMAHSFYDELTKIQGAAGGDLEKNAAETEFEDAALARANEIIEAYNATLGDDVAEAGEKTAEADEEALDEALTAHAVELLTANGYDVEEIHAALSGE